MDRPADHRGDRLRFQLSLQIAIMATLTAIVLAIPLGTSRPSSRTPGSTMSCAAFSIAGVADALVLARHPDHPRPPDHVTKACVRHAVDAADQLRAALGRSAHNLSMLIWPALATGYRYSAGGDPHDALGHARGAARGLRAHGARQGLIQKLIVRRHALRNALLPVVTIIGIEFAFLMGGLVVTEQVFNLNGLGKLFVASVANHDYTMTQALVMLVVASSSSPTSSSTSSMRGSTRASATAS